MESRNVEHKEGKKLIVVGVTGIFGSGKTTVGKIFQKAGIPYFSLDTIVHNLFKEEDVINQITDLFGAGIIKDGKPDRKAIAKIVFADRFCKKKLEGIIHPLVFNRLRKIILDWRKKGGIIVFEVPLLFETKSESLFDKILVVSTSYEKIISRLKRRFSPDEINSRLANQIPLSEKEKKATYVISNSDSVSKTTVQVKKIIRELQKELINSQN